MTEAEMLQRIEDLENKSGQAYQVIGALLWQCGLHETAEGTRALDYFSQDAYDDDFLPWPKSELG
ncbi:hypothetical protein EB230_21045 [Mesorhizobium sp. NZP2234]|uniref:hypothetical protein n=1 Tax=Mesorhizobium sp. NZP2234 TaxID=2483402 RepID=UPI001551ACED|nr:hypothetical protein [Mesorhizobium sp. NZP2234]QKC90611.1 hypothetical protein EB230_21045 [Mesorhizobium sp. NZP2234]